jgi:O-antigen ligase
MVTTARWLAYFLMTISLGAAVFLKGGVYAQQWEWSALGLSLGAAVWVIAPKRERAPGRAWELILMAVLLGWMVLQLVPLPPAFLESLSPGRWQAIAAAREATGQSKGSWAAVSFAPAETWERLLYVVPAMAAFVAAREMGWWWRDRIWIAMAPVVGIAWLESVLGLMQFYFMRTAGVQTGAATGTYVNRNHFAGLLEIAFPLAIMWAVATWRQGMSRSEDISRREAISKREVISRGSQPITPAIGTVALLAIAACLLMGVVLSLSRMGFISTLIGSALTMLMLLLSLGSPESRWSRAFRWGIPLAVPLLILVFLPTRELLLRFADVAATEDVSKDTRMQIWQDTVKSISDHKWIGSGLGAFERGLYRYKTVAPTYTVDFAHNDYLQIVAELGIMGAVLVSALGLWILARPLSVVLWRRGSLNWPMAVGLLAALLTLAVHSLADFNLYIPANALAFAWLCGIAISPGLREE